MLEKIRYYVLMAWGFVFLGIAGYLSYQYLICCTGRGYSWTVAILSLLFLWAMVPLAPRMLGGQQSKQVEYRWF